MVKARPKTPTEIVDDFMKEAEKLSENLPYDAASWHYDEDYPIDLPPSAVYIHLGMYLGWAIERELASDALKENNKEAIESFKKRDLLPGKLFRLCCEDEFMKEHLNTQGNAFTKKYYRPGWNHYYHADFHEVSGNEISGLYMADTWENYEKVKAMIDSRYTEWLKEQEKEKTDKDKDKK